MAMLTPEEKSENRRRAALALAAKLTPEACKGRARKAIQARLAKRKEAEAKRNS